MCPSYDTHTLAHSHPTVYTSVSAPAPRERFDGRYESVCALRLDCASRFVSASFRLPARVRFFTGCFSGSSGLNAAFETFMRPLAVFFAPKMGRALASK